MDSNDDIVDTLSQAVEFASNPAQVGEPGVPRGCQVNDEQAFLKAILDNPSDMAPRLVFADWLDEQGDDFCLKSGESAKVAASRIRKQIADGSVSFVQDIGDVGKSESLYSRNGFGELLYCTPRAWVDQYREYVIRYPINQVVFSERQHFLYQADSLLYYRERWPQISFHIAEQNQGPDGYLPGFRLDPPSDKPVGDLLKRHAEVARRLFES